MTWIGADFTDKKGFTLIRGNREDPRHPCSIALRIAARCWLGYHFLQSVAMTIDNAALRQFILQHFSDEELLTLCFDYFPDVYGDFGSGMSLNSKAISLIARCDRRGRRDDLHAALERERPETWRHSFGASPVETGRRPVSTPTSPIRDPRQVFISHATADAAFAHQLADDLRANGWSVWTALESIRSGEKWVEAIDRGLETSGVFVVALTPEAVASRWVRTETNAAITLEHKGKVRFLPLDLAECDTPVLWSGYQYVTFRTNYTAGLDELLRWLRENDISGLNIEVARPSTSNPGQEVDELKKQLELLERKLRSRDECITSDQATALSSAVKNVAMVLNKRSGRSEFGAIYGELYRRFNITGYKLLPAGRYEEAMKFLQDWLAESQLELDNLLDRRIHEKTGIELVRIPAGPFLYGSDDSDEMAYDDEKPQRTVDLPEYWIGRAPVTNAQFARFAQATGHRTTAEIEGKGRGWTGSKWDWIEGADWRHPRGPESSIARKDDHPVVQVSWDDAKAYCDWAGLALPTEEQWEKAARGADGRIWPWGNEPPTAEHCNFKSNVDDTTPVGKYSPRGDSPYGCVDMAGNVWEWSGSWYKEGSTRALRGGSWINLDQYSRAAFRDGFDPHNRIYNVGFRVAELLSDPGF